jgi:hypothetical protein
VFFWPGRCAACLGIDIGHVCANCGIECGLYANGRCARCELAHRVDAELASAGSSARPLADRLKASENPNATLIWLTRGKAWAVVREVVGSGEDLTHERLDDIPRTPDRRGRTRHRHDVEYARALLVAAGLLPPCSRLALRFQNWADAALASVSSGSDRWVVRRFCRERLAPTVEHQERRGKATTGTVRWAQARLRAAIQFMEWMKPRGGLEALNRVKLDEWLAGSTSRFTVRDFVRWAVREKLVDLPLSAMPTRMSRSPAEAVDHDVRAAIAHRLLHEQGIDSADRVAGLLIVLYGQHLSRIIRLSTRDARLEPTRLRLGKDWLEIPEPMAGHVRSLVCTAVDREAAETQTWLFPGINPGRHLSEDALSARLALHGIGARAMRNTAVFHLATSVQPHTLYRLLGLHPNTAVAWARVAGSVYASYWSAISDNDLSIDPTETEDPSADGEELELLKELGLAEDPQEFW